MNTFVTHPSIRIKGSENSFNPIQCMDAECVAKQGQHMHCPFCTRDESFVDPVILKAHYRVKHVDKGLDFAGLKILRCCDHCLIFGAIKGEKHFKGAHWHCYRCRNGFNRRDEALKHYKTHFRNPQTTFQIQVTQEVNQMFNMSRETAEAVEVLNSEDFSSIHPALTEAVMTTTSNDDSLDMGSEDDQSNASDKKVSVGEVHVSVAANETVGTSEGQTIMIIQEEPLENTEHTLDKNTVHITTSESIDYSTLLEEKMQIESELKELKQQYQQLEYDKAQSEQSLQAQIDQLKIQVQVHNTEISNYQKREQEMLSQLSVPLDSRIQQLLVQLGSDHQQLLHQQMALLKQTYQEIRQESSADLLTNSQTEYDDASTTTLAFQCKQTGEIINADGQTILVNTNGNEATGESVTYVIETSKYGEIECNSVLTQASEMVAVTTAQAVDNVKTKFLDSEVEVQSAKRQKVS